MADPERLWRDPKNWSMWGYSCKDDPRPIVPKRNPGMGWTMNWAHPGVVPALVAMLAIATIPGLIVVAIAKDEAVSPLAKIVAASVAIPLTGVGIVAFCKRMSRID